MAIPYDRIVDRYFIRQDDGRVIFRPGLYGGTSYCVEPEHEASLRVAMRRRLKIWRMLLIVCFVPIILANSVAPSFRPAFWLSLAAAWAISLTWSFWSNKRLTRGLAPAPAAYVPMNRRRDGWLDRTAAGQSYVMLIFQLILWPALGIYAAKDIASGSMFTFSAVFTALLGASMSLLTVATLYRKIRRGPALGGPLPEQLYGRSIFRPIWFVVIGLLLIALVELFIQAKHRNAAPTRQVALPLFEANLTNP